MLKSHKLSVYDPRTDKEKAGEGSIKTKTFEFLGVDIKGLSTSPSTKNRKSLLDSINEIICESEKYNLSKEQNRRFYDYSYISTLMKISNKIEGWGNQYKFCNNRNKLDKLDKSINKSITNYNKGYFKKKRRYEKNGKDSLLLQKFLGVQLLRDCKNEPYIP